MTGQLAHVKKVVDVFDRDAEFSGRVPNADGLCVLSHSILQSFLVVLGQVVVLVSIRNVYSCQLDPQV
jgi:hypothetical protein